ncbi:sulfatase [Proteiniborus sp. DW1]|uniref:sulfatase-like hydrolase/transferase n=1 Tax=Proteiniborus sp. DW1 TaxID=1889883 RepID=UPI00092E0AF6|nr:sulfatase-like hydrolase/transferase [Proteiniborus sp. DW1]SCG81810.1 sulfatase [Proteiniborus sp. DW1]
MNTLIKIQRKYLIELIALLILFFIKALIFSSFIGSGKLSVILSLISLIYIIFAIALTNILKGKKKDIVFVAIYTLVSLIMFADVAYFRYFNQLTSVVVLKQFSQLGTVGESILYVVKPTDILIVADIIPIIIYYIFTRKTKSTYSTFLGRKQSFSIVLGILAILILSIVSVNNFSENINLSRQEFFTYHISDVYNTIFSKEEVRDTDQLLKESIEKTINKEKNFYGVARGKNIITIQVEGLQNFVINREYSGQELTPNLNNLIKENSIYFDKYYQQLGRGNTSDAEFVTHNSLYPAMDGQTYLKYYNNTFYGLPWILKDNGYSTAAFHGYKASFWNRDKAYPYQGFDRYYNGDGDYTIKEPIIGLGINDSEFFSQSTDYIKAMKEPYYAFLVTLSSHHPFEMPDIYKKIKLMEEHEGTLFGNYIQSINYADAALGEFIERLKQEGLYENTIINIYGDHFGLSSIDEENKRIMTEYLGFEYDFDEMMKVPLIIHMPGSDINQRISITGGQIDFLPTVLNLLGVENTKGIMLGQDLVNAKEGFVAQQTYMLKGSYIKENMVFSMSRDGIFKNSRAWNINTREAIDLSKCREDYERAIEMINESNYILKNDLLSEYIKDRKESSNGTDNANKNLTPEKLISHAGGQINGLYYTNSREAIDKSYENGYKFIELDFQWTSDENLVLIHDWEERVEELFSVEPKMYTTEEFKNLNMINGLTQMTIEDLAEWLYEHKDVYIVTDIKSENQKALKLIKEKYPDLINQFIPQIYKLDEFIPVQGLGYSNIILTLYASTYPDEELIDFVRRHEIFAITMPIERARTVLPEKLKKENIFVYTHTINDSELRKELEAKGIDGFYTDEILP